MTNYQITIIVPIYKASSTIEQCARSLFSQTMTEGVEFLFVNDCTPDNSIDVLNHVILNYPKLKQQIRIIHNEHNLGVLETRKRGIKEAKGDYLAWVDSDDWIEPDMIEKMWEATQNGSVDIVVQNVYVDTYYNNELTKTTEWKLYSSISPKHALQNYHTDKYVPWGLPFQMSRRSLVLDASKRVHSVNVTEDAIMLIYIFSKAQSCVWFEKAFYHYICHHNSDSLTHRNYKTEEEWNRQVLNIDDVTKYLLKTDKNGYRITANYIKWFWKNKFQVVFDNSWSFWYKYKECYRDVISFDRTGTGSRLYKMKLWLKYNFYPIYWYKEGRYLFSK